ncbi:MAG: hypothetical protein KDA27_22385 [Candidatus Eisenbacteria bacterium]|uniref:Uncharacterized protein n=1 Tax=Eiseniibacteriota bacterium TaxID=2212470 RepID=A0A956NGT1_UNCEI|nr:hypothetical protein [Candidatus Eisenbacteria bacterium]MCB9464427.1 hypothetical protein [Candidatus Eisenbacteria bacterium]
MLIHETSLSETVDAVHAAVLAWQNGGTKPSATERKETARWIAGRQGLPGAYAGSFAGFEHERQNGIQLFTGERITSASARHILGEETCRALRALDVRDRALQSALDRADGGLLEALGRAERDPRNTNPGVFCCGKCTIGMWRNLLSGGLDRTEERLTKGLRWLHSMRNGSGKWNRLPFWYTVLALDEIDLPAAQKEIHYAAASLERAAKKKPAGGNESDAAIRRQALAVRALARL